MKDLDLFQTRSGSCITSTKLLSILEQIKAPDAKVLYMHTGLSFGLPNPQLGRRELLGHLYELIASLGIPNTTRAGFYVQLRMAEDYNVQTSRSKMGALNEYMRKRRRLRFVRWIRCCRPC